MVCTQPKTNVTPTELDHFAGVDLLINSRIHDAKGNAITRAKMLVEGASITLHVQEKSSGVFTTDDGITLDPTEIMPAILSEGQCNLTATIAGSLMPQAGETYFIAVEFVSPDIEPETIIAKWRVNTHASGVADDAT